MRSQSALGGVSGLTLTLATTSMAPAIRSTSRAASGWSAR